MIRPISFYQPNFRADKDSIDKNSGEYTDPLMKWPMRGAAFSNEVGEAMRPIIGNIANLTWIPVLMYIGADVYDKYKNDNTEYSPNSRRCLKQAIFQGLASVCFPVVAVKGGQTAFSQFGKLSKDKISINSKEHVANLAEHFIANGKMRAFEGKDKECVQEFLSQVTDNLEFNNHKQSFFTFFQKTTPEQKQKVKEYAQKVMEDLIQVRKDLLNPTDKIKSTAMYKNYTKAIQKGAEPNVAIKTALTNYQKHNLLKGNLLKTLGGFCALGVAIKPIDMFVENVLIGKYVGPKIDNMSIKKKSS